MDPIIQRLVERRKELHMSQRVLAQRAGIAPSTVNEIEHGKHSPTLSVLSRWGTVLGLDLTWEGGNL